MAQEKEIQSSYFLTDVKEELLGKGEVDYVNVLQLGFLLPHFTLSDFAGREFSLKDQIGKHHIILAFLHRADCSCTKPFLEALQKNLTEIKVHNGLLVGIGVDHPIILSGLVKSLGLEFPLLYDPEQTAIRLYTVFDRHSVRKEPHPALFLADTEGVIRHKEVSLSHADELSPVPLLSQLKGL